MFTPPRLIWLAVTAAITGFAGAGASAQDAEVPEQEVIIVRGDAMKVWPHEDLRARGFEIAEVPREENAYWTYRDAINAFTEPPADVREAFDYALAHTWPIGHDTALKAYILDKANQKALSSVRRAAEMEKCQLYYFGDPQGSIIAVLLPSLSHHRHLAKMLVVDGRRLEEQGAYDLAFRNYVAALRMGRHLSRGITLIENLVGVATWATGDRAIRTMVLRRDLPANQLKGILKTLEELSAKNAGVVRGLENERVFGLLIVDEITAHPFQVKRIIGSLCGFGDGGGTPLATDGWGRLQARAGQLVLPDRTIKKHMARHYDELLERARAPAYEARWAEFAEDAALMRNIPQWNVIARMLMPSLSRAALMGERCRMQTLATHLAAALRLHAKQHKGSPPRRLAELCELIPAEDLVDPFSGKEFAYDRDGNAWRFYSFSDNLTDDGGSEGERPFELDYVVRFPPPDVEPFEPEQAESN